jgi:transposase
MVTDHQVKCLFRHYEQTYQLELSALRSGMDRKTASKYIRKKQLPSSIPQKRDWRTREDPLELIWAKAEAFLSDAPGLEAKSLFEHLLEQHPDELHSLHLRTFQRRVKSWRIKQGTEKEIYFDQNRTPGECMQLDWTDMNGLNIFVAGEHYLHKLAHLVLPYSNYEGAIRCRSESILAIKKVLAHFLYSLNSTPAILQVDNSSAATHQIKRTGSERDFNDELVSIANYYGFSLRSTNISCPNENGDVESMNGHIKRRITQAMLLRGSSSFESMDDYDTFLRTVFDKANKTRLIKLEEELKVMKEIPKNPLPEYQEMYVTVRSGSTVNIKKVTYSVPSRLIGSSLKAKIFENEITLYNGADLVHEMPRVLGDRGQVIDYRHIIHSLVRKPGAFKNYRFRAELYPTEVFRHAFDKLVSVHGDRNGCLEYLRILKLSAETIESEVEAALLLLLEGAELTISHKEAAALVNTEKKIIKNMVELVPNLESYDDLIKGENDYDVLTDQSANAEDSQSLGHEYLLSGSDGKIQECQLVSGKNVATSLGDRDRPSEGEKDRGTDQAIRNPSTVFTGNFGPETSDSEDPKITPGLAGGQFCGSRGECSDIWVTG